MKFLFFAWCFLTKKTQTSNYNIHKNKHFKTCEYIIKNRKMKKTLLVSIIAITFPEKNGVKQ